MNKFITLFNFLVTISLIATKACLPPLYFGTFLFIRTDGW
jgi:hypothetical protein